MTRSARAWLLAVTAVAAAVAAGTAVVPLIERCSPAAGLLLRMAYRPACHQLPDRCLDLGYGPFAVCARCAGLYLGGLLGLAATATAARSLRPPPWWLIAAALPTALDVTIPLLGLPALSNWPRFAIALPLGLACGLFAADAVAAAVVELRGAEDDVQSRHP